MSRPRAFFATACAALALSTAAHPAQAAPDQAPVKVLMIVGSNPNHHGPQYPRSAVDRLAKLGVEVVVTEDQEQLNPKTLAGYDVLAIYKDHGDLTPSQEAALLGFVEGGKGFVPIHCASHAFRNSDAYTKLVGGRFQKHAAMTTFNTRVIDAQHPSMQGVKGFPVFDEPYVSDQMNPDHWVVMTRPESGGYEPSAWVRKQGKGRVFYTALGHDERAWDLAPYHHLLAQGIKWAAGRIPDETPKAATVDGKPAPLSPAESMKHMHLPEGMKVELYAAEPQVIKPIAIAFDPRGRVWAIESIDYPNDVNPNKKGRDRIRILEDTNGDGTPDKFTTFAEGLNIPTSLLWTTKGLIVARAPDILLLTDTNGDDVADKTAVLFTGFGRFDTHAVHSNLHYGFDNWIYGSVGYSGGRVMTGGKLHTFGQGYFRFKPDGKSFEFLTSTSNNTWGLGFGERGQILGSTANDNHSVHLAIPNRYVEKLRGGTGTGSARIEDHKPFHALGAIRQVDWFGGYTAAAGADLITADTFGDEYRGAVMVNEPTGHLLHLDFLAPNGVTGLKTRDGYNLLVSDDEWTAPIIATVGPDGAVWMVDWYNYIVRHNPTPPGFQTGAGNAYVTPDRDKTHGRIYRIFPENAKLAKLPKLDVAGPDELVAALGSGNLWWRLMAQQLIVEKDLKAAIPALVKVAGDPRGGVASRHALHALEGLGANNESAIGAALKSSDAGTREAALRSLPHTRESAKAIVDAGLVTDKDPLVRLAALLALADAPGVPESGPAIVALLLDRSNATDPWLPKAAAYAAAKDAPSFLKAASGPINVRSKDDVLALANVAKAVAEHHARGGVAGGAPATIVGVLDEASKANAAVGESIMVGLAAGWPASADAAPKADPKLIDALAALLKRLGGEGSSKTLVLAGRWGLGERFAGEVGRIRNDLIAVIGDAGKPEPSRVDAARQWVSLDDAGSVAPLVALLTPQTGPTLAAGLLDVLGNSRSKLVGPDLIASWGRYTPNTRKLALETLLKRPEWTKSLLDAIEAGTLSATDLTLDQENRLARHPDKSIAEHAGKLLAKKGRMPSKNREAVVHAALPLAQKRGDAAKGRAVFEAQCAKCHRHGSAGADIGPDLSGVATQTRTELIEHILDPNRSVEANYRQYTVATADGRVLSGLLAAETGTSIELLDTEAKRQTVLRQGIEELKATTQSLMPEGFEKLPPEQLVDLLEFLTTRGKFFPLPLAKAATTISSKGMFFSTETDMERLIFPKWGAVSAFGVPFQVIDPKNGTVPNIILLHSINGPLTSKLPRTATIPCGSPAKAIHMLSGVSGWGHPYGRVGSTSLIVRLHYADGQTEDHPLKNGIQFADYIRVVDVPGSKLAFKLGGQQIRYLSIGPRRDEKIDTIEFLKGPDSSAPVVMAVTVESK